MFCLCGRYAGVGFVTQLSAYPSEFSYGGEVLSFYQCTSISKFTITMAVGISAKLCCSYMGFVWVCSLVFMFPVIRSIQAWFGHFSWLSFIFSTYFCPGYLGSC